MHVYLNTQVLADLFLIMADQGIEEVAASPIEY
jgi:hypothetical protein